MKKSFIRECLEYDQASGLKKQKHLLWQSSMKALSKVPQLQSKTVYKLEHYVKTIKEFDCDRLEHVSAAQIKELALCNFIANKQNLVMIGNPGTGKTYLSVALGMKACNLGLNARFYTAANLSNELIEALDTHRLLKLEKTDCRL